MTENMVENRTERLARLIEAWRYDRRGLTADDIGWLLECALEAQEAGVGLCHHCARALEDPLRKLCWYCICEAEFLEGGKQLFPLEEGDTMWLPGQ